MEDENPSKWYNSMFAECAGIGLLILASGYCGKSCMNGYSEYNKERAPQLSLIEQTGLQRADLNGNGIPDLFYSIDGKVALIELDGNPIIELYQPK